MRAEIRLVKGEGTAEDWAEVQRWQEIFSTEQQRDEAEVLLDQTDQAGETS